MTKELSLSILNEKLHALVEVLRLDINCPWTDKFAADAAVCDALLGREVTKGALAELSSSITSVYGGMGSFNDYAPALFDRITGKYTIIPGTERFQSLADEVFELAVDLKVAG